jgi:hypothetical protein
MLENNPKCLAPNVIMRPLYQSDFTQSILHRWSGEIAYCSLNL